MTRLFSGLTAPPLLGLFALVLATGQRAASAPNNGSWLKDDLSAALSAPGNLQARLRFEHLTSAQGLSNDSVFAILQDRHGFMWFATQGGLNKYDGYRITQYRHDPKNPNSLGEDFIVLLFEDRRGGIWAGSADGTLNRLDPDSGSFSHYRLPRSIWAAAEDSHGVVWVGGMTSLHRLDPGAAAFRDYDLGENLFRGAGGIRAIHPDPGGTLWLGTDFGLIQFDPATGAGLRYVRNSPDRRQYDTRPVIASGKLGKPPLNTGQSAGNSFDRSTELFVRGWGMTPDPSGVDTVFSDPGGSVWLGTFSGIHVFNSRDGKPAFLRNDPADSHSLSANEIWSIAQDREGNLWVGVKGGGVNRLSERATRFGAWRHDPADPNSLAADNVRAIAGDRNGSVWLGTYTAGVDRFEPSSGKFVHYSHDPKNSGSLDHDQVYSVYEDRSGTLWVGTPSGINRHDPMSAAFKHFPLPPEVQGPLYYFLEDRAGRFWFGGWGGLLLDRSTGSMTVAGNGGSVSMYEDRHGNLWSDSGIGVSRLDPSGNIRQMPVSPLSPDGKPEGVQINFFHEDSQGLLWLATESGLVSLDPKTERYTTYTAREGLPDNVVQCILSDHSGNLWLSTNNGLSVFDPRRNTFQNFHEPDGLQGEQFNRKSCYEDSSGRMYFGGLHGFNAFDPREILANPPAPPAAILTEFQIDGKAVPVRPGSLLPKPIWEMSKIKLSYRQNGLSFEFAALSYRDPVRTRYRFRLEGLEKNWTEVDSFHRLARYTDLPPGTYTFDVQACNDGRTWGEKATTIGLSIAPPWWMTRWSRGGSLALLIGLLFSFHKWRLKTVEKRERDLQILVDQRTAEVRAANQAKSVFLANMSHELRTPLNAILGFSSLVRNAPDLPEAHRKDLDTVNRSGEHLLSLIDDVLDLSKIEAGRIVVANAPFDVNGLVAGVAEMMRARARAKNLALIVHTSPGIPPFARSDAAKVRQVLINLLGNAVKFTSQGSVTLKVDARPFDGQRILLILEVQDTGVGIAPEDQPRIFDAFVQAGQTSIHKGTGLGLRITRQFVQMMGGTIDVQSTPGEGSLFRVELPVEQSSKSETVEARPNEKYVVGLAPGQPEYRILIVEDKKENWMLLQRLLTDAGFRVRVAEDGAQGVEIFRIWQPHLIWMDLSLPVMRGMEAAAQIRMLKGGAQVRIVALSASVFAHQRDEALAAGLDDFLTKPYRREEIFECMARQLGLHYLYKDIAETSQTEPSPAQPEDLARLPQGLRDELAQALVRLDPGPISEVIERVSAQDAQLGASLRSCARRLAYTEILNAIEECDSALRAGAGDGHSKHSRG